MKIVEKVKGVVVLVLSNDVVKRALHTSWQTFIAVWAVTGFSVEKGALAAAAAAALSAAKTSVVNALAVRN